jgi:hypothetical protein
MTKAEAHTRLRNANAHGQISRLVKQYEGTRCFTYLGTSRRLW